MNSKAHNIRWTNTARSSDSIIWENDTMWKIFLCSSILALSFFLYLPKFTFLYWPKLKLQTVVLFYNYCTTQPHLYKPDIKFFSTLIYCFMSKDAPPPPLGSQNLLSIAKHCTCSFPTTHPISFLVIWILRQEKNTHVIRASSSTSDHSCILGHLT